MVRGNNCVFLTCGACSGTDSIQFTPTTLILSLPTISRQKSWPFFPSNSKRQMIDDIPIAPTHSPWIPLLSPWCRSPLFCVSCETLTEDGSFKKKKRGGKKGGHYRLLFCPKRQRIHLASSRSSVTFVRPFPSLHPSVSSSLSVGYIAKPHRNFQNAHAAFFSFVAFELTTSHPPCAALTQTFLQTFKKTKWIATLYRRWLQRGCGARLITHFWHANAAGEVEGGRLTRPTT